MASHATPKPPSRWLAKAINLPIDSVKYASTEPVITAGLLYMLTRGPPHIRQRLLAPFHANLLSTNGAARVASLITILKFLTAIGVAKRISHGLNRLALNNWSFGRPGAPFHFGGAKSELIVITGGSSGFGYEMVKGFSRSARVVVLDISPFPEELKRRESLKYRFYEHV
jgi:all-trans-retinol dehydrogenase (NAD+)